MLDLIYAGNMDSAWRLLDKAWPANQPNKEVFLKDFKEQLMASAYSADMLQLNGVKSLP